MNLSAFAEEVRRLGLELSDEQLSRFADFEGSLYEKNTQVNLTRVERNQCWIRHFLDSLLFHDLIPNGSTVLDIGTGPGFPAWPLACARTDLKVFALDSSGKMLAFLRTQSLDNLAVLEGRAEDRLTVPRIDVVTGRAIAPLSIQLELSTTYVAIGGLVIPMRTPQDELEIERLAGKNPFGLRLVRVETRRLPIVDAPRLFPIFEKVERPKALVPRRWAEMRSKPF